MPPESQSPTRLKALRELVGVTQAAFAALIGVSVESVKSIETGRLRISENLALKIQGVTGAMMAPPKAGEEIDFTGNDITGARYTDTTFINWRAAASNFVEARADFFAAACRKAFINAATPTDSHVQTEQSGLLVFLVASAIEQAGEEDLHGARVMLFNSLPLKSGASGALDLVKLSKAFDVRTPKRHAALD
jgi:DNA-binding XRE family transcriptional regulator